MSHREVPFFDVHHHVRQRFRAVQIEEEVDMVGDVVHFDQVAFLLLEDAVGVCVKSTVRSLRQHWYAAFGAENEVNQDFG